MLQTTADAPDHARTLTRYGPAIARLAASFARTPADRADLEQDIAVALLRALPTFRGESSEQTFVLRIAHHVALRHLVQRGVKHEDIEDHAATVTATSGKNPAVRYERKEREHQLLSAVRGLPLPARAVALLLLEGLKTTEIAQSLGITENAANVRVTRVRAILRVLLTEFHTTTIQDHTLQSQGRPL